MRDPLVAKFALRSLGRNARRTLLSVVGVAFGCAVALFVTAYLAGGMDMRLKGVSESGLGHLRVAPARWDVTRDSDLRLAEADQALVDYLRKMPDVAIASPHSRTTALLAFGTKVAGVEMLGVDPSTEQKLSRYVRNVIAGRYLAPGDEGAVVVGKTIAERLDVELGDPLLVTLARADGDIEYAMLEIVGIVSTGSRDIDASICHVTLTDVERLTGLPGAAEITITLNDASLLDEFAGRLASRVAVGDTVLTWREIAPGVAADARGDAGFSYVFIGIIIVIVVLGIASAQLTAVLERKREFAVLVALGVGSGRLVRLILLESLAIGFLGALLGLAIASPIVYYTSTRGIDFSGAMGGEMAMEGVLFDPIIYSDMGLWMIPQALLIGLLSTAVAALYPAWHAGRTNPTSALSLREA